MRVAPRSARRSLLGATLAVLVVALTAPVHPAAAAPAPPPAVRILTIRTVPPIAGVEVHLDDQTLVTGPDGTVKTIVTKEQRAAIAADRDAHLSVESTDVTLPDRSRAQFHGWYDGGYRYSATDRSGQVEVAAFDVSYLTEFSFVDTHGAPIASARVSRAELRDQRGATVVTRRARPAWLVGRSVVASGGRVSLRDVQYRFTEVLVDGANVVRRGQVRFWPRTTQQVSVPVTVFPVTFDAHDAIFGLARGSKVEVESADGRVRTATLKDGSATVTGITPGKYTVRVDAMGMGKEQTFEFSKATTAEITIIDPLDLALVVVVGVLAVGGLVLIGLRMRRRRVAREQRDAATRGASPTLAPERELSGTAPR